MARNLFLKTTVVCFTVFQLGFINCNPIPTAQGTTGCQMSDRRKTPGVCKKLSDCQFAVGNLQSGIHPTPCVANNGKTAIGEVCCPLKQSISAEKCEFYKNSLRDDATQFVQNKNAKNLTTGKVKCETFLSPYISGGRDAGIEEYPHQVALGYGSGNITWRCGGTLISDEFVMTAGHCVKTNSKNGLPVKVLLGDRRLSKQDDPHRFIVDVLETIPHPEYKPPLLYNDIALIKLKSKVKLSRAILPACLPHPDDRLDKKPSVEATGWGQLGAVESQSDILQTVTLNKFGQKDCAGYFTGDPSLAIRLPLGITRSQFCAGDKKGIRDTCRGDSGGPVVVNKDDPCVFYVIGVTSFGSNLCGYQQPGVYTVVQRYLDWIEDIVWSQVDKETSELESKKPGSDFIFPYIKTTTKSTTLPPPTTTQKQVLFLISNSRKTETTAKTLATTTMSPQTTSPINNGSTTSSLVKETNSSASVGNITIFPVHTSTEITVAPTTKLPLSKSTGPGFEDSKLKTTHTAIPRQAITAVISTATATRILPSPNLSIYSDVFNHLSSQIESPMRAMNETNVFVSDIYDSTNISNVLSAIQNI